MAKKQKFLVDEEPFNVPSNWVWTTGAKLFMPMETRKPSGKTFDYIDIDSIDNCHQRVFAPKVVITENAPSRASRGLKAGDTIFSLVRPYLKNIAYIDETLAHCIASTGFYICRPSNLANSKYIYWLMTSGYVVDGLNGFMKGDNSPSIRKGDIEGYAFPLPPLAEQQRIVDRIESLFDKLDQAKELVQSALDSFDTRKAAILHKAFTGDLTQKWREEHGIGIDSWEECPLSEVSAVNPKRVDVKGLSDELIVTFVPMPAVSDVLGIIETPQEKMLGEVKKGYTNFRENDVIFAKITPCMENGKTAIVGKLTNDIGFGSTEFHVLRCSDKLNNHFLYHTLRSQHVRDEAKAVMSGAVGQQRVPKSFLESFSINRPSVLEQEEIVRILDNLFGKEQQAKELCDAIEKIDLMKKAILARAFRGELGTNDPKEESALKLLKEICAERGVN